MSKSKPKHPGYKKMKATPWIKQAKEIGNAGGEGLLENYNNVNVFDKAIKDSLEARNNAVYQRAFSDMNQNYNNIMNKYNARNYNRFGTLNSTPSAYATDNYQKDFQRQMDDLSYNKAVNYENLINNELTRRYNTLDLYNNMYNLGQYGYQHDKMNWNVDNTNRDISYKNSLANSSSGGGLGRVLSGGLSGAGQGFAITDNPLGALTGGVIGGLGGYFGNSNNASGGFM